MTGRARSLSGSPAAVASIADPAILDHVVDRRSCSILALARPRERNGQPVRDRIGATSDPSRRTRTSDSPWGRTRSSERASPEWTSRRRRLSRRSVRDRPRREHGLPDDSRRCKGASGSVARSSRPPGCVCKRMNDWHVSRTDSVVPGPSPRCPDRTRARGWSPAEGSRRRSPMS